jgi:hypothetical protein
LFSSNKNKSAVSGFLVIAGFNALAGSAFLGFYFLMINNDKDGTSTYLLVASIVAFFASIASIGAYRYFVKKISIKN